MRPPLLFRDPREPLALHPKVREGRRPRTTAGKELGGRIPELWERIYAPELDALGKLLGSPKEGVVWLDRWAATVQDLLLERQGWADRRDQLDEAGAIKDVRKRRKVLDKYLAETVSSSWSRFQDRRALHGRYLDVDVLLERVAGQMEDVGYRLEVAAWLLAVPEPQVPSEHSVWSILLGLVADEPRAATRRAAARAALVQLSHSPPTHWSEGQRLLSEALLGRIEVPASDPIAARTAVRLLPYLGDVGHRRLVALMEPSSEVDHFLVRAMAAEVAINWLGSDMGAVALRDPSDTVRMAALNSLARRLDDRARALLIHASEADPREEVRAEATLLIAGASVDHPDLLEAACQRLRHSTMVARRAADELGEAWAGREGPPQLVDALVQKRDGADPIAGDRAAYALERMIAPAVSEGLKTLRAGETVEVAASAGAVEALARGLAPYAVEGLGYSLQPRQGRVRIFRGDRRIFRFWRLLHEIRNPGPSKRQGVSHLLGITSPGTVRIPPYRMTEATPTAVPGQRVFSPAYWGWAPYLPGVEDVLDSLWKGAVKIVTPRGTTELVPPAGVGRKIRAWFSLNFGFHRFDQLRQASLASPDPGIRGSFSRSIGELGFQMRHRPHPVPGHAPSEPAPPVAELMVSWFSVLLVMANAYRNTGGELAVMLVLVMVVSLWAARESRGNIGGYRRSVALVVGGWGTRGKSGSERLKASVFEGLGMPVFSKTTGCEAMILHAPPGGRAQEVFLFRPMDMATIWENANTLRLASRMRARVYLWECMALNARYVDLLQRSWLQDDASTLTNSYPDHEDIQGPTGLDVSESISGFTPEGSLLVTTEEHMVPVMEQRSIDRRTEMVHVQHGEGQRLPADLRARLPYQEHPRNMAMVCTLAAQLGVDPMDALILMGDHVVPDLGALMVLPPVPYNGRRLRFINGHSANDLASFSNCWRFTGLSNHHAAVEPARWVVLVVNNRHDRVARSRVFARIVVKEAPAHRHVIMGSNLEGFRQYVQEALNDHLPTLSLFAGGADPYQRMRRELESLKVVDPAALAQECLRNLGLEADRAFDFVEALARSNARPGTLDAARQVDAAIRSAAEKIGEYAATSPILRDDVEREATRTSLPSHLIEAAARWSRVQTFASHLATGDATALDKEFRTLWSELLWANIVFLQDFHASGDQVLHTVASAVPPGVQADVLGSQNIKGTGLQWVYGWVNLLALQKVTRRLDDPSPAVRADALRQVEGFEGWSLISALWAREELKRYSEATPVMGRLEDQIKQRRAALVAVVQGGMMSSTLDVLERFLEPFDAIRRRYLSDRIFEDLSDQRVSHSRAALLLRDLTERQKGGWLRKSLRKNTGKS